MLLSGILKPVNRQVHFGGACCYTIEHKYITNRALKTKRNLFPSYWYIINMQRSITFIKRLKDIISFEGHKRQCWEE